MIDKVGVERNQQGQYDLAKRILTVLDSVEGAVNRLIEIRAICYETIETYETNETDNNNIIFLMDPLLAKITAMPSERDIKTQMERLEHEGQIEPIALKPDNSPDLDECPHADAQVMAAIRLDWPTILVTYDYKDND